MKHIQSFVHRSALTTIAVGQIALVPASIAPIVMPAAEEYGKPPAVAVTTCDNVGIAAFRIFVTILFFPRVRIWRSCDVAVGECDIPVIFFLRYEDILAGGRIVVGKKW